MSLDKGIKHGKEHRRPFKKSKGFSTHCRNGNMCYWCLRNRMYSIRKAIEKSKVKDED